MKNCFPLYIVAVTSCLGLVNSFHTFGRVNLFKQSLSNCSPTWNWQLRSSPEEDPMMQRPNLVGQSDFAAAIETLRFEAAKAKGIEYQKGEDIESVYAIGRIEMELSTPPQIGLVETPYMCLINGVTPVSQEEGIQPLDTIVSVSAVRDTFKESTLGLDMDETSSIIRAAMDHAAQNGESVIKFEVNRLIRGFYGDEEEASDANYNEENYDENYNEGNYEGYQDTNVQ